MSTQSHIDPPAGPVSRRSVLRGAAVGAGAAGLAAAGISPALASTRPAVTPAAPIVVYLRDAASGELEIFAGTSQIRLRDPAIAARLARAVR